MAGGVLVRGLAEEVTSEHRGELIESTKASGLSAIAEKCSLNKCPTGLIDFFSHRPSQPAFQPGLPPRCAGVMAALCLAGDHGRGLRRQTTTGHVACRATA